MIFISFKSFIPFPTPPAIKKYLDDYNKAFLSRTVEYYCEKSQTQKHHWISQNQDFTNLIYPPENNIISDNKELQLHDNSPFVPNRNITTGVILFSISSLFMYLLSKKY